MESKNDFRVQMMRVVGDLTPFVEVGYVDQDANEHTALMIVDSCSCHNIIIGSRVEKHGIVLQKEEGSMKIGGAGNEMITTSLAKFHFVLGGEKFNESFCVKDGDIDIPSEIGETPIIGILGNLFMQQYRLAIDYSDYTLHTSNVSPATLPISACDFFFPMKIGLEKYGVPVLVIKQNGKNVVVLADTGATDNMIASKSLEDNGFDCRFLESVDKIAGIGSKTEVKEAIMKFCLITQVEGATDVVQHEDLFKVTPHYMINPEEDDCDEKGKQLPPVVGIIGSPFMAKEGWVLDFGVKYIYKRKAPKVIDMNLRVDVSASKDGKRTKSKKCNGKRKRSIRFFVDATEAGLPMIRVDEGNFEGLIMLIDTGSLDNLMFGYAFHQLEKYMTLTDQKIKVYGINGNPSSLNFANCTFSFCGKEYDMKFLINENNETITKISQEMGFPVAGIIGTKFMAEHGWVIDFGKQEILIPPSDVSASDIKALRKKTNDTN